MNMIHYLIALAAIVICLAVAARVVVDAWRMFREMRGRHRREREAIRQAREKWERLLK